MRNDYPWTISPLIISAPMRLIALAPLAVAVSRAGGLGFLAAGTGSDLNDLDRNLQKAADLLEKSPLEGAVQNILPIGVGFINWGANFEKAKKAIGKHVPAAVWFFAPKQTTDLHDWAAGIREVSGGKTKVWVQVGTVSDALEVARTCHPDVLVVQGTDAGGHGLDRGAGIISLLPEVADALSEAGIKNIFLVAAGGITEGRGTAACLALGASGVVMGTRFLASNEAEIAKGYQDDVVRVIDGGVNTVRSDVYDTLRGTTGWPEHYGGRGIINQSYSDVKDGGITDETKRQYAKALQMGDKGWGEQGRLTAYAGTGVGLIKDVKSARDILDEVRTSVDRIQSSLFQASSRL